MEINPVTPTEVDYSSNVLYQEGGFDGEIVQSGVGDTGFREKERRWGNPMSETPDSVCRGRLVEIWTLVEGEAGVHKN